MGTEQAAAPRENERAFIECEGEVIRAHRGDKYEVAIVLGALRRTVMATRSGRLNQNKIRLNPGDRVKLEISPYDTTRENEDFMDTELRDAVKYLLQIEADRFYQSPSSSEHPDAKLHASLKALHSLARNGGPPLVSRLADELRDEACAEMRSTIAANARSQARCEGEIASDPAIHPERRKQLQHELDAHLSAIAAFRSRLILLGSVVA
jgi:translation initiation factor IF-1